MTIMRSAVLSILLLAAFQADASLVDIADPKQQSKSLGAPAVVCPSGPGVRYISRNSTCVLNFICKQGRIPFKVAGCGCGCHPGVATVAPVKRPVKPPVKTPPTKTPVTTPPTKAPSTKTNTTCPIASPDIVYKTHNSSCTQNFGCVAGYATFRINGCGCGCHRVKAAPPKPNATVATKRPVAPIKPSHPNATVATKRPVAPIKPTHPPVKRTAAPVVHTTLAPAVKFNKPTSSPK